MNDIDLLIRKESVSRAEDKLAEHGYSLRKSHRSKEWFKEYHHHLAFVGPEATSIEFPVEVHWNIHRPNTAFHIDIDGMWNRVVRAKIADVDVLVLSNEDLILHLCLHACYHRLIGGIRALCDITETVRQYAQQIDWSQLHRRSYQWDIGEYVYVMLRLAKELLGAGVPECVLDSFAPPGFDSGLIRSAREEILGDKDASPVFPELAQLWNGRRLKDRVDIVARILSPRVVATYQGISPTSKRIYQYYPARLKHLLFQYGPVLWGLIRRDQQLTAAAEGKVRLAEWLNKC